MTLSVFDAANEAPHALAVVDGGAAFDYEALAAWVGAAIAGLSSKGIGSAARPVAIVARSGLQELIAIHALAELRVPWVALHPRWTANESREVAERAGAGWLLDGAEVTELPVSGAEENAKPDSDILAVVPTSGTTGRPKLAMLPRGSIEASAAASAANLGWQDDDRWLLSMPLAHVGGLSVVTRCLIGRRCVVLMDGGRFDADAVIDAVERRRVTLLSVVPTMLYRMLEREPSWCPPARMRAMLVGGASASRALMTRAWERGYPALATYGLTEACSQVTTQRIGAWQRSEAGEGSPLPGVEVRIEAGRVLVRGPTMMRGYLGEASPFDEAGWFATGDGGAWDELGNLHVHGRRADLIVSGGENVYPAEIEGILGECPGVRAACVFGVPDPEWGQCVAVAVAGDVTEDEVTAFAAARLASFKRPRYVRVLPELVWTQSGKIDRGATVAAAIGWSVRCACASCCGNE